MSRFLRTHAARKQIRMRRRDRASPSAAPTDHQGSSRCHTPALRLACHTFFLAKCRTCSSRCRSPTTYQWVGRIFVPATSQDRVRLDVARLRNSRSESFPFYFRRKVRFHRLLTPKRRTSSVSGNALVLRDSFLVPDGHSDPETRSLFGSDPESMLAASKSEVVSSFPPDSTTRYSASTTDSSSVSGAESRPCRLNLDRIVVSCACAWSNVRFCFTLRSIFRFSPNFSGNMFAAMRPSIRESPFVAAAEAA